MHPDSLLETAEHLTSKQIMSLCVSHVGKQVDPNAGDKNRYTGHLAYRNSGEQAGWTSHMCNTMEQHRLNIGQGENRIKKIQNQSPKHNRETVVCMELLSGPC